MKMLVTQTVTTTRELDLPANMPMDLIIEKFGMLHVGDILETMQDVADTIGDSVTYKVASSEPRLPPLDIPGLTLIN